MTTPIRVAVADDEPIMRIYLEDLLPDWGYTVVASAENGQDLVDECREHRPDLVVTDVRMPKLDGIRAVQQICREADLPVVFVSGFDERERLQELEGCVSTYLMKPIGELELKTAIEEVLDRFRESRGE